MSRLPIVTLPPSTLASLYLTCGTITATAARLGVSYDAVRSALVRAGISRYRSDYLEPELLRLHAHTPWRTLARITGRSTCCLRKAYKAHGIDKFDMRSPSLQIPCEWGVPL